MDENCSQSPDTEVGRNSPSKPPILEFNEVGKVSPNDRAESPDTNCAICLGKLQNKSFTDSCLHQFCFNCLLEWSKVKAECPLCKQSFKSIIHNVRSMEDYEQYHLCPSEPRLPIQAFSYSLSGDENQPRFRYRTTMVPGQPLFGYLQRLEHMMSRDIIPPGYIAPHRWSSRRPVGHGSGSGHSGSRRQRLISPDYPEFIVPGTSGYRRHIYNNNIWVRRVPDITGRFRECSAEFFLNNPAQVHRLVPWLNRELNVLLHGTEHETPHIVTVILDLLPRYNIRSQEFRNAMLPYLGERTDHFIHEFYAFGTSPCDMIGYDQICVYGPRFQFSDNDLSDSSSDSDVQIIDVVHISDSPVNPEPRDLTSRGVSHTEVGSPIAGPSYSSNNHNTLIALSSGEDSDTSDCQIVGSVKPRHLRTPEVITLESDQEPGNDETNENNFSELSEGEIDYKPVFSNGSMTLRWQCNGNACRKSLSILSSSEESSGEEWGLQQQKRVSPRVSSRKNKKEKRDQSSSKSKNKEKEVSRKKRVVKDKKSKPVKHWKKKLCRKIESSSSSDEEPIVSSARKRRIISSSSCPDSDVEHKVDHDYINPFCKLSGRKGRSLRLKSVVHVKKNTREADNTSEVTTNLKRRDSTRGLSICSGSSSRCSTNYSLPSTSSRCSPNYTARIIPNGEYNPRILFRRKRLPSSSSSSSLSSTSSLSSSSSISSSHKQRRHKKVKSKRKHT